MTCHRSSDGHCDGSHAGLRNTVSHNFVYSEVTITMPEYRMIQRRGQRAGCFTTMADRAAFAENWPPL